MSIKRWLVLGLWVCASGCTMAADSTSKSARLDDGDQAPAAEAPVAFQLEIVRDFRPPAERTGVHGISSWQASLNGDAAGRVTLDAYGGDPDGLIAYAVRFVVVDPANRAAKQGVVLSASLIDGTDATGKLDDEVRVAIADDLADIAASIGVSTPLSGQSLRTQGLSEVVKQCWFPIAATAVAAAGTALAGTATVIVCAEVTALVGPLSVVCWGYGVGTTIVTGELAYMEATEAYSCMKSNIKS